MLGVGGVGLFCGRGHLQTRQIKANQGKSRGIEGIKVKLSSPSEIRGISGIRIPPNNGTLQYR